MSDSTPTMPEPYLSAQVASSLTDEQIEEMAHKEGDYDSRSCCWSFNSDTQSRYNLMNFARAIERAAVADAVRVERERCAKLCELPEAALRTVEDADGESVYPDYYTADQMRAYALAAVADAVRRQWLPIETAPTDGTEFLAFKPAIGVFTGCILDTDHPDCQYDGGVHCTWDHEYVEGVTHWMPRPPTPATTGDAAHPTQEKT